MIVLTLRKILTRNFHIENSIQNNSLTEENSPKKLTKFDCKSSRQQFRSRQNDCCVNLVEIQVLSVLCKSYWISPLFNLKKIVCKTSLITRPYLQLIINLLYYRSNQQEVFCERGVVQVLPTLQETPVSETLFLIKLQGFIKKDTPKKVFPVNFTKLLWTYL